MTEAILPRCRECGLEIRPDEPRQQTIDGGASHARCLNVPDIHDVKEEHDAGN